MRHGSRYRTLAVLTATGVAVVLALGACAEEGDGEVAAEPTGVVHRVDARDDNFRPETIEIDAGDTVQWVNRGRSDHDVIPVDDDWQWEERDDPEWGVALDDFGPGAEYEHTFTEPGEYPYVCTIHAVGDQGMVGTVVVTGDG